MSTEDLRSILLSVWHDAFLAGMDLYHSGNRSSSRHEREAAFDAFCERRGLTTTAPPGPGRRDAAEIERLVDAYDEAAEAEHEMALSVKLLGAPWNQETVEAASAARSALLAAIAGLSAGVPEGLRALLVEQAGAHAAYAAKRDAGQACHREARRADVASDAVNEWVRANGVG